MKDRVERLVEVHIAHYRVVADARVPCVSVFLDSRYTILFVIKILVYVVVN